MNFPLRGRYKPQEHQMLSGRILISKRKSRKTNQATFSSHFCFNLVDIPSSSNLTRFISSITMTQQALGFARSSRTVFSLLGLDTVHCQSDRGAGKKTPTEDFQFPTVFFVVLEAFGIDFGCFFLLVISPPQYLKLNLLCFRNKNDQFAACISKYVNSFLFEL